MRRACARIWLVDAVREGHGPEPQLRVADRLALGRDLGLRHGIARALVLQLRRDGEHRARSDEGAKARLVDRHQERHVGEAHQAEHEIAGSLGHGLGEKNAGHEGMAGEVPFEDRAFLGTVEAPRSASSRGRGSSPGRSFQNIRGALLFADTCSPPPCGEVGGGASDKLDQRGAYTPTSNSSPQGGGGLRRACHPGWRIKGLLAGMEF